MHIPARTMHQVFHVFVLKFAADYISSGNKEITEIQRHANQQHGSDKIRIQKTLETDATAQNGNDFGMARHLRGEENHRNESEKIDEQIDEIGGIYEF